MNKNQQVSNIKPSLTVRFEFIYEIRQILNLVFNNGTLKQRITFG